MGFTVPHVDIHSLIFVHVNGSCLFIVSISPTNCQQSSM